MTFDVTAQAYRTTQYGWQDWYELFAKCRNCRLPSIFLVSLEDLKAQHTFQADDALVTLPSSLNNFFKVIGPITLRDNATIKPPDHLPEEILRAFNEGAACLSIGCYNAAASMFRLCLDLATRPLMPEPADTTRPQPNSRQRRDLGLRLRWLFEQELLPPEIEDLAACIREDANDGAHVGNLSEDDAKDILDFTNVLLERLYTYPKRLAVAEERRAQRRSPEKKST
jgi:hypothetical protein